MKATKSRREQFEEQLKDLQNDISSLSHKLSVPTIITANRFGNTSCKPLFFPCTSYLIDFLWQLLISLEIDRFYLIMTQRYKISFLFRLFVVVMLFFFRVVECVISK